MFQNGLSEQACDSDIGIQYYLSYYNKMNILIISALCALFVICSCLLSGKFRVWPIKIILTQSIFELMTISTGLLFFIWENSKHPQFCKYMGYVRYCCWITSLSCSFLLIYMQNHWLQLNKDESGFSQASSKLNISLVVSIIFPYLWLLIPLQSESGKLFGAYGWRLYGQDCKFQLLCGATLSHEPTYYLIFWAIPLVAITGISTFLAQKNKRKIRLNVYSSLDEHFVYRSQVFPVIYISGWMCNLLVEFLGYYFSSKISHEVWLYVLYQVLNLVFHLHIVIATVFFVRNYRVMLDMKYTWKKVLGCCWEDRELDFLLKSQVAGEVVEQRD